ncbi:hypothetical protein BP5796_11320 [Coleophoma crateriformis]|uniref:Uncharacterized protein n=1 Tax=Coleophoma crateriformis TaxID=565419 RepID=A0A3D8QIA8_9HELO|nr:hypothetical protein BP5796_11320 [Coleophoma crateriformis]
MVNGSSTFVDKRDSGYWCPIIPSATLEALRGRTEEGGKNKAKQTTGEGTSRGRKTGAGQGLGKTREGQQHRADGEVVPGRNAAGVSGRVGAQRSMTKQL